MMTKIMVITKINFTRNMTKGSSLGSQVAVLAEAFQEEVPVAVFQEEVLEVDSQEEVPADSQAVRVLVSRAEELRQHHHHNSLLKKPRHLPLLLIQEASEGAYTDIRMFG
jgi:hypothetical protein